MMFERLKNLDDNLKQYVRTRPALIAVSKMQPDHRIDEAVGLGLRHFGENRVQEAVTRWAPRRQNYPDLILHLIGPLQTNKVAEAVALFDVVHTLDRVKLIDALATEMEKQGRYLPCFIQVNTGEELQKSGVMPRDLNHLLAHAVTKKINVMGLMCIPPVGDTPALHFALLKTLAARHGLTGLSMGMSDDYKAAVKLGATHIRIGSALFGSRENR